MIRTAIPFGYLFIAMFLFAAFLLGVGLFIWGWWRRSRIAGVIGGGMVFGVIALIAANVWYGSALEWNPTIENDAVIVGTWTDHAQTITLAANKTSSYRTSSQLTSGTWARNDDDLNLRGDNYSATMRFVQEYVGTWYLGGLEGYPKDPVEAAKWFRKSAEQGDAGSQNLRGQLYVQGKGVPKDYAQALQWFLKAANQGEPHACVWVGVACEQGIAGMPKDKEKAIEWYRKAGNEPKAKEFLARLGAG